MRRSLRERLRQRNWKSDSGSIPLNEVNVSKDATQNHSYNIEIDTSVSTIDYWPVIENVSKLYMNDIGTDGKESKSEQLSTDSY